MGAVYTLRAMDRDAIRATIRATVITSAILVLIMVTYRLASGGFNGNLGTAAVSASDLRRDLPAGRLRPGRGLLPRAPRPLSPRRPRPDTDRATALYGSALWGIWHLPVMSIALGIWTIPYLVAVHTILGYVLVTAWRRTGNLAAPGIAHAVSDALRNAVAVL